MRNIILWVFYWFYSKVLFETDTFDRHYGIVIAEFGPEKDRDLLFVPKTKEALDFLAKIDKHRFHRVQKEIRAIVKISNLRKGASFHKKIGACLINFDAFAFNKSIQDSDKVKLYACLLVHEATHGVLENFGIPLSKKIRNRIERICVEEEIRLSRRFRDGRRKGWEKIFRDQLSSKI